MAKKSKISSEKTIVENGEKSNSEVFGWLVWLAVLFVGAYIGLSIFSYFFNYKADISILLENGKDINPNFDTLEIRNSGGKLGAWIGEVLVGRGFGFFALVIPFVICLFAVAKYKSAQIRYHHLFLNSALVLLLGSLTLGLIFGKSFDMFGSGCGGSIGVATAHQVLDLIGGPGSFIIVLCAWIFTGVLINRNFIDTVNALTAAFFSRGTKIVKGVKDIVTVHPQAVERVDEDFEKAQQPIFEPEPQVYADPEPVVAAPAPAIDDQPFVLTPQSQSYESEAESDDDIFSIEQVEDKPTQPTNPFQDYLQSEIEQQNDDSNETEQDEDFVLAEVGGSTQPSELGLAPMPEPTPQQAERDMERPYDFEDDIFTLDKPVEPQGLVVEVECNELELLDEQDIDNKPYDPTRDLYDFKFPPVKLLEDYDSGAIEVDEQEIFIKKAQIQQTLLDFGIPITKIHATVGPTITLYEIIQQPGVKISKIQGLENDIAQSIKAPSIRIIAPIPSKGTIGIEVPNSTKRIVSMYSALRSKEFQNFDAKLPVVIGRTIQNKNYVFDLAKMPHLLVAGATGQGKSVGLNAIITSLLYRKNPAELKFVMIDPKMVEFSLYKKLEHHYMAKMESEDDVIITDAKKAVYTLNALCDEMEKRLKLLSEAGVRNLDEYNTKFKSRRLRPDKGHFFMPYIVVIIDEFADLIMIARDVEKPVMRLAQKARAVGIHLIVATQRPDVKVITGGIKANFPARIAFKVTQMIDSRTILDQTGANQLIGRGDMLFSKDGEMTRIQCALVETNEVESIVEFISQQQGYPQAYQLPDYAPEGEDSLSLGSESGAAIKYDSLFAEIARTAVSSGNISTSAIQRNFEVGFNRAGRIMSQLERAGIVGRAEGAKPREIMFHDSQSLEARLQELGVF